MERYAAMLTEEEVGAADDGSELTTTHYHLIESLPYPSSAIAHEKEQTPLERAYVDLADRLGLMTSRLDELAIDYSQVSERIGPFRSYAAMLTEEEVGAADDGSELTTTHYHLIESLPYPSSAIAHEKEQTPLERAYVDLADRLGLMTSRLDELAIDYSQVSERIGPF